MAAVQNWFDRVVGGVAPRWQLKRIRARVAADILIRHYEAGSIGRRTQGWRRSSADANQAQGPYLSLLRDRARDLVRNNANAEAGLSTIVDHAIGWGIVPKPTKKNDQLSTLWKAWAETTACDADGRHDFYGLEKLVKRTVVESGECLVRRRLRRPEDGLPLPLQLQVLEPDFLDTTKDSLGTLQGGAGNRIIQGVEFDALGRRMAYWLFPEHPGSNFMPASSHRVAAENVLHCFKSTRPGQVRGVSWFAPTLLRFKDWDEFEDATLMKQKIAACLAVIMTDPDGSATPLGEADTAQTPEIDMLEPGGILNVAPGRTIEVVRPPSVADYAEYSKVSLRTIATGLGIPYEDFTGDYTDLPFSAARMSQVRHWRRVEDWRWRLMVPQFCDPAWRWFVQTAAIFGVGDGKATAEWTAPPAPMIDPVNEGLAYMRNIRAGIMTLSEALRERGYDPETVLAEMATDLQKLDELQLILDSDPRNMTQAGQLQGAAAAKYKTPAPAPASSSSNEDELAAAARHLRAVSR
jgi:lambda family phage portal protein